MRVAEVKFVRVKQQRVLAFFALTGLVACTSSAAVGVDAGTPEADFVPSPPTLPWLDASAPLPDRVVGLLDTCAACHALGAGGLVIQKGAELTELVGVHAVERPELLRVAPGDPQASYLYLKLRGDGGILGAAMPDGTCGPESEINGVPVPGGACDTSRAEVVNAWIEAGAPSP